MPTYKIVYFQLNNKKFEPPERFNTELEAWEAAGEVLTNLFGHIEFNAPATKLQSVAVEEVKPIYAVIGEQGGESKLLALWNSLQTAEKEVDTANDYGWKNVKIYQEVL